MIRKTLVVFILMIAMLSPQFVVSSSLGEPLGFVEWQKTFNSGYCDIGTCVQPTSDGGYICLGHGYGYHKLWLIKLDKDGNKQWDSQFGNSHPDYAWYVLQTDDGGYIVLGETEIGGEHVWLIKTDQNGTKEWERFIGYRPQSVCVCIQHTNDGGYILTGFAATSVAFLNTYDTWLLKVDSEGFEEWNRTFVTPYYDFGFYVVQTSDGGFIITGTICQIEKENTNLFLIKTDSNGYTQWVKTYGESEPAEKGMCVQQTTDGGYIVAGEIYSSPSGNILIKTDEDGDVIWTKPYGGRCVQQTSDGGYITTGQKMRITGYYDLALTKVNSNGKKQWERLYGKLFVDDAGRFVRQTSDGGFIVTGYNGSWMHYPAQSQDLWVIKTGEKPPFSFSTAVEPRQTIFDLITRLLSWTRGGLLD